MHECRCTSWLQPELLRVVCNCCCCCFCCCCKFCCEVSFWWTWIHPAWSLSQQQLLLPTCRWWLDLLSSPFPGILHFPTAQLVLGLLDCDLHQNAALSACIWCPRFPDPYYAYFTNDDVQDFQIHMHTSQTTSQVFIQKENFTWLSRNPKKKVSASCYCCCCTFSCAGNLHTLSEMLLGFQTFASCTSLYDRLARTSSSIELLPICSRRHFGALKYIIRVRSASCALIDPHTFFVTAACYKLRYKQSFYINLSLENKTYLSRLNFSHTHTHSHIYILHRSIDQSRER